MESEQLALKHVGWMQDPQAMLRTTLHMGGRRTHAGEVRMQKHVRRRGFRAAPCGRQAGDNRIDKAHMRMHHPKGPVVGPRHILHHCSLAGGCTRGQLPCWPALACIQGFIPCQPLGSLLSKWKGMNGQVVVTHRMQ